MQPHVLTLTPVLAPQLPACRSKGKGGEKQYASFDEHASGHSPTNGANAQFMQSASGKGLDGPSKGGSATSFVDAAV